MAILHNMVHSNFDKSGLMRDIDEIALAHRSIGASLHPVSATDAGIQDASRGGFTVFESGLETARYHVAGLPRWTSRTCALDEIAELVNSNAGIKHPDAADTMLHLPAAAPSSSMLLARARSQGLAGINLAMEGSVGGVSGLAATRLAATMAGVQHLQALVNSVMTPQAAASSAVEL